MLEDKLTQQKQFTVEYFKLRIEQETELSNFKYIQLQVKNKLKKELSKIQGVSIKRVNFGISAFKNIECSSSEIYYFIEESMTQSNYVYYKNNKDKIIEYIEKLRLLKIELTDFKNEQKKTLNKFKRTNKYCNISVLNNYYSKFNSDLKTYMKLGVDVETYQKLLKEYNFAEEILNDMFIDIAKSHETKLKEEKELKERIKEQEVELVENALKTMFIFDKELEAKYNKEKQQEQEVMNILLGMRL